MAKKAKKSVKKTNKVAPVKKADGIPAMLEKYVAELSLLKQEISLVGLIMVFFGFIGVLYDNKIIESNSLMSLEFLAKPLNMVLFGLVILILSLKPNVVKVLWGE